jgi:hypothetical protein
VSGLDERTFSPHVQRKIITAAAETHSYDRAAHVLHTLAEVEISSRQINRITDKAGARLRKQQQQRVEDHQRKTLNVEVRNSPALAVVEFDGGRIRTRETGCGSGTHDPAWKESKTALFMRMASKTYAEDPAPEPPPTLLDRDHVGQLAKEIAGASVPQAEEETDDQNLENSEDESTASTIPVKYEPPKRILRTCLASLDDSDTFGQLMAAEAHRKGFSRAKRKAFVADGMKCNWSIQKEHFGDFVPIVDFIHAVSYLYKAAVAIGEDDDFGWGLCSDWIRGLWQGRVGHVIQELDDWLGSQPAASDDVADDDPREVVRLSRGYLSNNQTRMDYPTYRKQGLPLTSTLMESLIKEMNYRVKGTEKFWNNPDGANHILAIKAAALSEDDRLYTIN